MPLGAANLSSAAVHSPLVKSLSKEEVQCPVFQNSKYDAIGNADM